MTRDHYEVLGVDRHASDEDIKRAYRDLARRYHPDSQPDAPDAEERFKEISVAYENLRDPERRRRYDVFGDTGAARSGGGETFGFGDLFDAFFAGDPFGARRGPAAPTRGGDAEVVIQLTLTDTMFGKTETIDASLPVSCPRCDGSGCEPGTHPTRCDVCGGALHTRSDDNMDTARHRLDVYEQQTRPIADFYRTEGLLLEVDGLGDPDEVFSRMTIALDARLDLFTVLDPGGVR